MDTLKELQVVNNKMTTLQFVELTGSRHDNVLAKARKLLLDLGLDELNFQAIYKDAMNRDKTMIELDRDLALTLAGQYEPKIAYHVAKAFNSAPSKPLWEQLIDSGNALKASELRLEKSKKQRAKLLSAFKEHLAIDGLRDFKDTADIINRNGLGRTNLMKLLHDHGWLLKSRKPARAKLENGTFVRRVFKQTFLDGTSYKRDITLVTEKGVVAIIELINNSHLPPLPLPPTPTEPTVEMIVAPFDVEQWYKVGWTDELLIAQGKAKYN